MAGFFHADEIRANRRQGIYSELFENPDISSLSKHRKSGNGFA
jgi:hypothetical protein